MVQIRTTSCPELSILPHRPGREVNDRASIDAHRRKRHFPTAKFFDPLWFQFNYLGIKSYQSFDILSVEHDVIHDALHNGPPCDYSYPRLSAVLAPLATRCCA